jgi:hypothetical protein
MPDINQQNIYKFSLNLIRNTLCVRYRDEPVNAVWRKSRCLFWEPYEPHKFSPYLIGNTLLLRYIDQPVNPVWGNSRCLLWEPYGTHTFSPYLTGNTLCVRYRDEPVNAVYCENHTEHTDTVRTGRGKVFHVLHSLSHEDVWWIVGIDHGTTWWLVDSFKPRLLSTSPPPR